MKSAIDIGGYTFQFVGQIEPERAGDRIRRFMPQGEYRNVRSLPLNRYGEGPFCRFRIPSGLHTEGVYVITAGDDVMYVGECVDLSKRFNAGYGQISPKNCFKGGQETNCRINSLVLHRAEDGEQLGVWLLTTPLREPVEAELIGRYNPPWNR
ncbi:MAG: GIY-YIG nuclease family protein [Armatimonadetes bacterium]|nr:GIY-YIG nuclease family protein [Armatimonadota bacterium]